jgi:CheY-like chemotaxis protein
MPRITTPSATPLSPPVVLVVDDHAGWRDILAERLRRRGAATCTAGSGAEAVAVLERAPIDLVVTDHRMPGASGLDLLAYVHLRRPGVPVVVMSAVVDDGLVAAADAGSAAAVLEKDQLVPVLDRLVGLAGARAAPESALAASA